MKCIRCGEDSDVLAVGGGAYCFGCAAKENLREEKPIIEDGKTNITDSKFEQLTESAVPPKEKNFGMGIEHIEKEFNLSKEIECLTTQEKLALGVDVLSTEFCYVKVSKIKEFIRRLKDKMLKKTINPREVQLINMIKEDLDNLAGDGLK